MPLPLRVLIVDDSPDKVTKLENIIKEASTNGQVICTSVTCCAEARERLNLGGVDLLLLDVALPKFKDDKIPDPAAGIDLLREIVDAELYSPPKYIIGITAHEEILRSLQDQFSGRLWSLLFARHNEKQWLDSISQFIKYAIRVEAEPPTYRTDCCILTALNAPEFKEVTNIDWAFAPPQPLDEIHFYRAGAFETGGHKWRVAAATASRMGPVWASVITSKIVAKLAPRILVMTGICAGIKGKANLGDVIIPTEVWSWDAGKYLTLQGTKAFVPDAQSLLVSDKVITRIQQLQADTAFVHALWAQYEGPKPTSAPKIITAPMASGAAVIASNDLVQEIVRNNRRTAAIDMESFAVQATAASCGTPMPTTFTVKAVCDFADENKNDSIQEFAAYMAAQVTKEILERFVSEF